MIPISFSTAFFIYVMVPMLVIFALWFCMEYKNQTRSTHVESKMSMTCSICFQSYLVNKTQTITRCPFCQSWNDGNEKG